MCKVWVIVTSILSLILIIFESIQLSIIARSIILLNELLERSLLHIHDLLIMLYNRWLRPLNWCFWIIKAAVGPQLCILKPTSFHVPVQLLRFNYYSVALCAHYRHILVFHQVFWSWLLLAEDLSLFINIFYIAQRLWWVCSVYLFIDLFALWDSCTLICVFDSGIKNFCSCSLVNFGRIKFYIGFGLNILILFILSIFDNLIFFHVRVSFIQYFIWKLNLIFLFLIVTFVVTITSIVKWSIIVMVSTDSSPNLRMSLQFFRVLNLKLRLGKLLKYV